MFTKLKALFKAPLGLENTKSTANAFEKFGLEYRELEIGTLVLQAGEWSFEYSNEFKQQDFIQPLIDFPDKQKVYKSPELWPFFLSRIPGLSQPSVKEVLKSENINEYDEAALLKRFGKKSISSPFLLVPELT